jgi:uncharacterized protein (TIRG00374 family)
MAPGSLSTASRRATAPEAKPVHLKKSWLWLLAASIGLSLAVPLALGGLGQFKLMEHLSWWAAILFALMMVVSWLFNSWRIRMLMRIGGRRMSWHEAVLTTASAEFAGVTTPGGVGMPATYIFLFHRLGFGVPEAVGLEGLIIVTDLAFYVTVMPLAALILLFEAGAKPNVLHLVAVVMVVLVGTAAVLWNLGRHYRRICICIGRQMGKVSRLARYRYRLARATVQFVRSLRLLQKMSWPQYLALSLVTLGFWLPRYLLLFLIIHLLGQAVPLSYLVLVQGALNLGSQIFLMPGGGGTVDAGYAVLLSPYLDRETLAFTLLVWRTYTFYWFLIVGGPIFLFKMGQVAHDLISQRVSYR